MRFDNKREDGEMELFSYIFDEGDMGIGVGLGIGNLDVQEPDDPRILKNRVSNIWERNWKIGSANNKVEKASDITGIWTRIKNTGDQADEYRMLKQALGGRKHTVGFLIVEGGKLKKIEL